eukprot:5088129-Amphidinium_carterae.1
MDRLCPKFERVHVDTPRKWRPSEYSVAVKRLGRLTLLRPFHLTRISETVAEISERLVVSSHVILRTLKDMEVDIKPSEKGCKHFMRSVGYSYKKPEKDTQTYHNDFERAERIENLRLKIVWFQKLMPSMSSAQSTLVRLHAGCCLCTLQDGCSVEKRIWPSTEHNCDIGDPTMLWYHASCSSSASSRNHICCSTTSTLGSACASHAPSPTGLASTETIVEFIRFIDSFTNPLPEAMEPWLLVWDLCSVYTSKATRALIKDTFPHLSMACAPGNSTGYAQPLDVAVVRPFKCRMKHYATDSHGCHGVGSVVSEH